VFGSHRKALNFQKLITQKLEVLIGHETGLSTGWPSYLIPPKRQVGQSCILQSIQSYRGAATRLKLACYQWLINFVSVSGVGIKNPDGEAHRAGAKGQGPVAGKSSSQAYQNG
jgi:hypothetical protein